MISVIVPAWNEGAELPRTLSALAGSACAREILVVDAASTDHTREVATELGARVLLAPQRQRAAQMNLGAEHARGEVLLFLHADTVVPPGALERIHAALEDGTVGGGAFARKFDSASPFLFFTCALAELRNRAIGWHLGDQGIFARASLFNQLGGFRPMDRFEDLDFSRRMGRAARLATLRPPVVTSARRFQAQGPWRGTVRDFVLTMRYLQGKPSAFAKAPGS